MIESPTQEDLSSAFICAARNKVGTTRKRITVTASEFIPILNLLPVVLIDWGLGKVNVKPCFSKIGFISKEPTV